MNFVVMCFDTLRYDHLGCNGNDWIQTPNFDAFAREAIVFDNMYGGSLPTIPHRTDSFTGRFGEPLHQWLPLGFDAVTLPALMGEAGWATYLVCDTPHLINGGHGFDYPFQGWHFERGNEVDQHIVDDGGFDRSDEYFRRYNKLSRSKIFFQYVRNNRYRHLEEGWPSPRVLKAAGDFIEMNRRRKRFFLWVDSFDPHEPWDPPEHYVALYDDPDFDRGCRMMGWEPFESLSERELKHLRAHYAGEVTMADRHLGRFLDRLAASGRDKDTVVIITTDHGTNLGNHGRINKGGPIYEQVGHELLMIRVPGAEPGRRAGIVQPADLMPTVLDLAGLETSDTCQGRSFAGTVTGPLDTGRTVAVSGAAIDVATKPADKVKMTVQDQRWCLIAKPDRTQAELYDKEVDRAEEHNILSRHPDEAERLYAALVDFLRTHEAHPSLVQWFETGERGDVTGYIHRPPYLRNFTHYWQMALDAEMEDLKG